MKGEKLLVKIVTFSNLQQQKNKEIQLLKNPKKLFLFERK